MFSRLFFKRSEKACTPVKADELHFTSSASCCGGLRVTALLLLTENALLQELPLSSLCKQSRGRGGNREGWEVPNRCLCYRWQSCGALRSLVLFFLCSREPLAFDSLLNVLALEKCSVLIQEVVHLRSD